MAVARRSAAGFQGDRNSQDLDLVTAARRHYPDHRRRFAGQCQDLSSAASLIVPRRFQGRWPLTITPSRLPPVIAATTAIGTALANAHGEAATSTTSALCHQSSPSRNRAPRPATNAAATITAGTSELAMRSASRCPWPLRA
jgi:hypothetical protein